MDHKNILDRLDRIEEMICDLRLLIIEDIRGSVTPEVALHILKSQIVEDTPPDLPDEIKPPPEKRSVKQQKPTLPAPQASNLAEALALGIKSGVFKQD